MPLLRFSSSLLACFVFISLILSSLSLIEEDQRLEQHYKRNYDRWPDTIQPRSPIYIEKAKRRYRQVQQTITTKHDRYKAHVVCMGSTVVVQNFTRYGWALTRIPNAALRFLQSALERLSSVSSPENETLTSQMGLLSNPQRPPLLAKSNYVSKKILKELQYIHEEWSGMPLKGAMAYGIRLYQNESQLLMHIDNPNTHVISSIVHVARDDDDDDHGNNNTTSSSSFDLESWPLVLEDLNGTTVVVHMTPGDMVLYESSKVLHGRPKPYRGNWYASMFLHYYPQNNWDIRAQRDVELQYAVPETWQQQEPFHKRNANHHLPRLELHGMGLMEPTCQDDYWCGMRQEETRLIVNGPGQEGVLRTSSNSEEKKIPTYDEWRGQVTATKSSSSLLSGSEL